MNRLRHACSHQLTIRLQQNHLPVHRCSDLDSPQLERRWIPFQIGDWRASEDRTSPHVEQHCVVGAANSIVCGIQINCQRHHSRDLDAKSASKLL
jgi:hypothetical protein